MRGSEGKWAVLTDRLRKEFGSFTAVDDISFGVRQGEIFGFLGPNGAGKTTTIRMLLGLLKPSSGRAEVLGYDVAREPRRLRQNLGYVSQRFSLYDSLTVEENLDFYGGVYGLRGRELKERKLYVMKLAGLEGRGRDLTRNLAVGFKQRLALGAAVIHRPRMLFLDEPTAGVDPISRRQFWNLLYELASEGTTIMVTTHYMDEAEHCQNLAFVQRGRLVAQGSPRQLRTGGLVGQVLEIDAHDPERALRRLRAVSEFEEVALYGSLIHVLTRSAEEDESRVRTVLAEGGLAVRDIQVIAPSLEDVFIRSTRQSETAGGEGN